MATRNWPQETISLGAALLVCAAVACWIRPKATPDMGSLERAQTPVLQVEQRESTLEYNRKGAVVGRIEGGWDLLLDVDGSPRWLALGIQPQARASELRSLSGETVVALHDAKNVWQLEGPSGTIVSYAERARDNESLRSLGLTAFFFVTGTGCVALGVWLGQRRRRVGASAS
jgi:hypothetical protein